MPGTPVVSAGSLKGGSRASKSEVRELLSQVGRDLQPWRESGISLQMVFGVIAGGMYVRLGPTVGAAFTLLLAEGLRLGFGNRFHALDTTVYGLMLVLFIIYMPKGILGAASEAFAKKSPKAVPA